MTCRDWRDLPAPSIEPLYETETNRWAAALHWDTRAVWQQVERARAAGSLPGFVAEASGRIVGWTFCLLHRGSLQVGALVSSSPTVTRELVDDVLASDEASAASTVMVFAHGSAPGLPSALEHRGFAVERYLYMERALGDWCEKRWPGCGWDARHVHHVARLLSRAYESRDDVARPFAREGDPAAWLEYVRQLTTTAGCGVFLPHLSVIDAPDVKSPVSAAVLTTTVGPGTGHLAQVAVDPGARGTGRGRRAVAAAISNLKAAAFDRVTLLVGERNVVARRLYQGLGFVDTGEFVSAVRDQPRRLSSVALETGGASTFR